MSTAHDPLPPGRRPLPQAHDRLARRRILARIRPGDPVSLERKALAHDLLAEVRRVDRDLGELAKRIEVAVMNRSFWTAATSSGLVVNSPMRKWFTENDAETIFERLEAHGRTWKVYVMEPMVLSFTGLIHFPRLKDRLATHFVPFAEFERDAAAGTLPGLLAHRAEHAGGPR